MARGPATPPGVCAEPELMETFTHLTQRYLAETPLRPATVRDYLQFAYRFDTDMHSPPLADISRDLLLRWRRTVLDRARPTTWNTYFTHWRTVWRWALVQGFVDHDPLRGTRWSCRVAKQLPRTVSHELLQEAIDRLENQGVCEPGWFWAMVLRTLYFTGIRRRQLVELRWGDVELARTRLKLRSEGSKSYREWDIVLHPRCVEDLTVLRQRFQQAKGRKPRADEQVFNVTMFYNRYRGQVMHEGQLSGFFRRLSRHLDRPCSAHRLRHTLATDLTNLPQSNLKSVQELMGHADIRTTLADIHPDFEAQRAMLLALPPLQGGHGEPDEGSQGGLAND